MTLLCFLLDFRSLSPQLLQDLKKSLLLLANLYALSPRNSKNKYAILEDRIGLCYIKRNQASCLDELRFAYIPRGNFSLPDFHHGVNSLQVDDISAGSDGLAAQSRRDLDMTFNMLLSKDTLYSWGSNNILRKIIYIASCLPQHSESLQKSLKAAAENCTSVEFVILAEEVECGDIPNDHNFSNSVFDLENCLLRRYFTADTWIIYGLVKKWLQEIKEDGEDPHQAIFVFKNQLVGSTNEIYCNLFASVVQVPDGFTPCQACRCHGILIGVGKETSGSLCCQVTNCALEAFDLVENAVQIGDQTVLFLPSSHNHQKLETVSPPVTFNVRERTSLALLNEGIVFGTSYVVIPAINSLDAVSHESADSELNIQIFNGLSRLLYSLDQGLICSSYYNIEKMKETVFQCFYIAQPSEKGPLLLRRLASFEEIMLVPDIVQLTESSIPEVIQNSIEASLLQMELREYNPLLFERGVHSNLNCIVKESLLHCAQKTEEHVRYQEKDSEEVLSELTEDDSRNVTPSEEEWAKFIVCEASESSTCVCTNRLDSCSLLDASTSDEKTWRFLERLEAPKLKRKALPSHILVSNLNGDSCVAMGKPMFSDASKMSNMGPCSSQPMRPTFQKMKRKSR